MVPFGCHYQWDEDDCDNWEGWIESYSQNGSTHDVCITGRGSKFRVVLGKSSFGDYICIPEYDAGCFLADLSDTFSNVESLARAMDSIVDATTVAWGLKTLKDILAF